MGLSILEKANLVSDFDQPVLKIIKILLHPLYKDNVQTIMIKVGLLKILIIIYCLLTSFFDLKTQIIRKRYT